MSAGRVVRVVVLALLVGLVPSAVVVSSPVAMVPTVGDSPPRRETAPLPHLWADGQPPVAAEQAAVDQSVPGEPVADEPVARVDAAGQPVPVVQPVPGQGVAPSDGSSIAERNNRIATPRPSMDETLGTPVQTPPQVIGNGPAPVVPPTTDEAPSPPAPTDPEGPATTQPPTP